MKSRVRWILAGVALALLAAAFVLNLDVRKNDDLTRIASELNAFGYSFADSDIYVMGEQQDTSIRKALGDTALDEPLAASVSAGFPSDVDAVGDIVVMLAHADASDVITIYLLDGRIEMCFVQNTETGAITSVAK